jgi:tRNA (adenine37-N6)-methyltransferase
LSPKASTGWPSVGDISSLPPNHRRAVASVLRTLEKRLTELDTEGQVRFSEGELLRLRQIVAATGSSLPERSPSGLLAALAVLVDGLEPDRLAGYGRLSPVQRETLSRLAERVRRLLATASVLSPEVATDGPANVVFTPIGVVRSPFKAHEGTPIQPRAAEGRNGFVELFPEYAQALADLEGFERIWIVSLLERGRPWRPQVIPYLDSVPHGLFATRAPSRPNPVGISSVRLLGISGCRLDVSEIDLLDGTPVLDIKPYVPAFDAYPKAAAGWVDRARVASGIADDRFANADEPPSDDSSEE